jgi:hypothetical protein
MMWLDNGATVARVPVGVCSGRAADSVCSERAHDQRECTNRFGYWIPALARRAKPGSPAGMTATDLVA